MPTHICFTKQTHYIQPSNPCIFTLQSTVPGNTTSPPPPTTGCLPHTPPLPQIQKAASACVCSAGQALMNPILSLSCRPRLTICNLNVLEPAFTCLPRCSPPLLSPQFAKAHHLFCVSRMIRPGYRLFPHPPWHSPTNWFSFLPLVLSQCCFPLSLVTFSSTRNAHFMI